MSRGDDYAALKVVIFAWLMNGAALSLLVTALGVLVLWHEVSWLEGNWSFENVVIVSIVTLIGAGVVGLGVVVPLVFRGYVAYLDRTERIPFWRW